VVATEDSLPIASAPGASPRMCTASRHAAGNGKGFGAACADDAGLVEEFTPEWR